MAPFQPLSQPATLLGYHRQLAPAAGIKVSSICLGAMNFGTAWKDWLGECNEQTSFEILDYFYSQGGNFIDTAVNYQATESETILGNWMAARGNRDEMVIATKYGTGFRIHEGRKIIQSNFGGLNAKNLKHSLDSSLAKLQTSFVDILYVHWWDSSANIPEVMHALNDVVAQGKVLYLGISDTPGWIVAKANEYAKAHHLRQFVVYQGRWSAAHRDFERDIIPLARADGMAIAPWGVLGQGLFKTREQREAATDDDRKSWAPITDEQQLVVDKLEEIARRKETSLQNVAIAYTLHKTPYVFPVLGGRKLEQLKSNLEALNVRMSRQDMDEIDMATGKAFDLGFPQNTFAPGKKTDVSGDVMAKDNIGNSFFWIGDEVPFAQPIQLGYH
ncbi:Norsolorinic acid A [Cyphellophora attinorum]|uniref:Norsolorinic acid A n=1 Tax=Cyphellophora attinorum TaxID=1664694 RepID=A0A0N1H7Y0_9EURO|nr:Norsolorinic acid A [Phialophora attinorum]KPI38976.1 Norsolorinic acid A [Phialophora attinorum]